VLEFFETSGRNLLPAEASAGVRHHVALSIVGTDRTPNIGYFRAKVAQEKLIETSGIPLHHHPLHPVHGISRQHRRFERGGETWSGFRPDCSSRRGGDVAPIVVEVALAGPRNGIVEIAGPERAPFNEIVACYLKTVGDPRQVVSDPEARALTRGIGRSPPRPHRSRRMATPLTAKSLILHSPSEGAAP
jgi:uncharacterized protein YbjT (DUF2867 family)